MSMRLMFSGVILILVTLLSTKSKASIPTYAIENVNFISYALGDACYSIGTWEYYLPCNPAFIAFDRPNRFFINFFGTSDLSHYNDVQSILGGSGSRSTVDRVFSKGAAYESQANLELGYYSSNFGVSLSPSRYYIYDSVVNPPLPRISLLAMRETNLRMQFGSFLSTDWAFGIQGRLVKREFIYAEAYLTDFLVESGPQLLATKSQYGIYAEPGFVYAPEGMEWNPMATFALSNLGFVDRVSEAFSTKPSLHIGGSVNKRYDFGDTHVGMDSYISENMAGFLSSLRLGILYNVGIISTSYSIARDDYILGLGVKLGPVNLGFSIWNKFLVDLSGQRHPTETYYVNANLLF